MDNDKIKCFINGEFTDLFGPGQITPPPQWKAIESCLLFEGDLKSEIRKFIDYDASTNKRSFCGNKLIYNYFGAEMLKTRYKGGATLQEIYEKDPKTFWLRVCKMDRRKGKSPSARDCFELNRAVTFFKPSIAKHIYHRFGATSVLDPCAGWGGRMLGALGLGIKYTGYDTNDLLAQSYQQLCFDWNVHAPCSWRPEIRFESCLEDSNWRNLEYDNVLTSPPYENLEIYPGMRAFKDDEEFYCNFLAPMINKCRRWINPGGKVCINISPKMYDKLIHKFHYEECVEKIDFLQQMGQNSGKKEDFIYVWDRILIRDIAS